MDEITSKVNFCIISAFGFLIGSIIGVFFTGDLYSNYFFLINTGSLMCLFGGFFMSFAVKERQEKIKLIILCVLAGSIAGSIVTLSAFEYVGMITTILFAGGTAGLIISLFFKDLRRSFLFVIIGTVAVGGSIFGSIFIILFIANIRIFPHLYFLQSPLQIAIPLFAFFWGLIISPFFYHFLKSPKE